MDLRNWFLDDAGNAVVGADVYVYEALTSHPNAGTLISQTQTDPNGMWSFTGLTDTPKDVKIVRNPGVNQRVRWYKGLARVPVSDFYAGTLMQAKYFDHLGQAASPGAPGSAIGRDYYKTDGKLYGQYGASGEFMLGPLRIDTQSGNGGSATLAFTSIPATFRGLLVQYAGRSDTAGTAGAEVRLSFETTPTAGFYSYQTISAANATVTAAEAISSSYILIGHVPTAGATANYPGTGEIKVPQYAQSGIARQSISQATSLIQNVTGNFQIRNTAGFFIGTGAISTLRLTLSTGNWTNQSQATLWGLP